jgi:hypothetical protein
MKHRMPDALRTILLGRINPARVGYVQNKAHVEAYEIRAHLIRCFDFDGWEQRVLCNELVFESSQELQKKDNKGEPVGDPYTGWTACYRAQVELTIHWRDEEGAFYKTTTYTEWATGDSQNQPSRSDAHDNALKTAESQALKRCAMNLGDQFGLSLYKKGSMAALVGKVWHMVADRSATTAAVPSVDAHIVNTPPESEQPDAPEPAPDNHVQSEPPKEHTDEDTKALRVADLTTQLGAAKTRAQVAGIAGQVMKEKLAQALTDDGEGNVLTLGALVDATLKRVARAA